MWSLSRYSVNCQCIRMPRPRRTKHARSPSASHSATGSPTSIGTLSDAPRRRPSHRHRRKRSPSEHSSRSTVEPRRARAFARKRTLDGRVISVSTDAQSNGPPSEDASDSPAELQSLPKKKRKKNQRAKSVITEDETPKSITTELSEDIGLADVEPQLPSGLKTVTGSRQKAHDVWEFFDKGNATTELDHTCKLCKYVPFLSVIIPSTDSNV